MCFGSQKYQIKKKMGSARWMWVGQVVLVYAMLFIKAVGGDCGENYTTIDITSVCSKSTCVGECRHDGTCCLEYCFQGTIYDMVQQSAESCERLMTPQTTVSCSYFENITRCAADYLNKDFEVCWKQVLYELTQIEESINEFNPLKCPCEGSYTPHVGGKCDYLQCRNTTQCETVPDTVRDIDVCCIHKDILPKHIDCEKHEQLDMSVHDHHNISTIVQCQSLCEKGVCRMPDSSRLPACCRQPIKRADVIKTDEGLHGAAIAAIAIVIILFVIIGGLVLLYVCRTRINGNIRHRMQERSCEMVDAMKATENGNSKDIFDSFQVTSCTSDHSPSQQQEEKQQQHEQLQQHQQPLPEQQQQGLKLEQLQQRRHEQLQQLSLQRQQDLLNQQEQEEQQMQMSPQDEHQQPIHQHEPSNDTEYLSKYSIHVTPDTDEHSDPDHNSSSKNTTL